jgi:hypothetical protein
VFECGGDGRGWEVMVCTWEGMEGNGMNGIV